MRREVQADVLGIACTIVVEKDESKWQAFGVCCGEPIGVKGAKTRKAAVEDWRQRAEQVASREPKKSSGLAASILALVKPA